MPPWWLTVKKYRTKFSTQTIIQFNLFQLPAPIMLKVKYKYNKISGTTYLHIILMMVNKGNYLLIGLCDILLL